jgi:hypothetical protein
MALPNGDDDDDGKRTELEGAIYNELDKTNDIAVADRYVKFTRSFCYLGSMVP